MNPWAIQKGLWTKNAQSPSIISTASLHLTVLQKSFRDVVIP